MTKPKHTSSGRKTSGYHYRPWTIWEKELVRYSIDRCSMEYRIQNEIGNMVVPVDSLSEVQYIYECIKPEKMATPYFVAQFVKNYGITLNHEGKPILKAPETVEIIGTVGDYHNGTHVLRQYMIDTSSTYYDNNNRPAAYFNRYDFVFAQKKPEKMITKYAVNHQLSSLGKALV